MLSTQIKSLLYIYIYIHFYIEEALEELNSVTLTITQLGLTSSMLPSVKADVPKMMMLD